MRWCVALVLTVALAYSATPDELLRSAAEHGDVAEVRSLLSRGADPNARDEHGGTPLMITVSLASRQSPSKDRQAIAALLLDKGADVNARDKSGHTALLMAVEGSASEYKVIGADETMVHLLIARGAAVNNQDNDGWSPLLRVVGLWADQPELIAFLLTHGADANARLSDGRTPLMLAARLGKEERIPLLIAKGADVNARDQQGATALMVASTVRWEEAAMSMMKLLAARGADLNVKDEQGRTAADRAAQAGYFDRATFLLNAGTNVGDRAAFFKAARNHAMLKAIHDGPIETARTMLDAGADPDSRDETGRTALMIAAEAEYSADRVVLLLEHGASPNLAGKNKLTPLMVAAANYQPDIVKVLLDHGADPNAVDESGETVLLKAAASRRSWHEEEKPLIHFLLEKGADRQRANPHGITPLMLMAGEGNPAVRLLLDKDVDVNARDDQGNTALHYAARSFVGDWQQRIGGALLEKGAAVNAANHDGETPLILAATQYRAEAAELLLDNGADVNAKTKSGRTALMQAIDGPKDFDNTNHVVYSPAIAKLLIARGADVNARDAEGNTPLTIATRRGYTDMQAALRKAGAKQ
jgi:ankyrin repeat protein